MSQSVKGRTGAMAGGKDSRELRPLLEAMLADLTALRATIATNVTDVAALATAVDVLAAKLNSDSGVNDTDFSVVNAAAVTAAPPSTLITTV